jgi:hypothetical protein
LCAPPPAAPQGSTSARLEGERLTDVRALADYVEDGARYVAEEAQERFRNPSASQRSLLASLRSFATATRALRGRVERSERVSTIDAETRRLQTLARRNDTRLRREPSLRDLQEDWEQVTTDLADIRRVLAGRDVDVRRAAARDEDRAGDDYVLPRRDMDEFRVLARDVEAQARRVLETAERGRASWGVRGDQVVADLRVFAGRAASLRRHADADVLRPRDVGPAVAGVLADARRVDETMRMTQNLRPLWTDWERTIRMLEQMASLLRVRGDRDDDRGGLPVVGDTRDDGYDYSDATLPRRDLDTFRRLAAELDTAARHASAEAEEMRGRYGVRGEQLVADLRAFAARAAAVSRHAEADALQPRNVGANVDQLLADAARVDEILRYARVGGHLDEDWRRVQQVLAEMRALLRR